MWRWLKKYHADLVRRGTDSKDAARYGELQRIALPWLIPLAAMVMVAIFADRFAGDNANWVSVCAALLLGLPATLGILYATGTYLSAGLRADQNKRRTLARRPLS